MANEPRFYFHTEYKDLNSNWLKLRCNLPVAELLHKMLVTSRSDLLNDEDYAVFSKFRDELHNSIREMK